MKHVSIFLLALGLLNNLVSSQTLKRMSRTSGATNVSESIAYRFEADIFEQYAWAGPQIAEREIDLSGGSTEIP